MGQVLQFKGNVIPAAVASANAGHPTLLLHVVNTRGGWGAGFSGQLSAWWPAPEKLYRAWAAVPDGKHSLQLGRIQAVRVQPNLHVVNCCAQLGYSRFGHPAFRIAAMEDCLVACLERYPRHRYYLPKVGAGLGGGDWPRILGMLDRMLGHLEYAAVFEL